MEYATILQESLKKLGMAGFLTQAEWAAAMEAWSTRVLATMDALGGSLVADARWGSAIATTSGGGGALLAGVLPPVLQAGVFVALGAPYYEARKLVQSERAQSGFSQGWVAGLLKWQWSHVASRFNAKNLRTNPFDEHIDALGADAFNAGMIGGYAAGLAIPNDMKKAYLTKLRALTGITTPADWNRASQISYVIALASKARLRMLRPH